MEPRRQVGIPTGTGGRGGINVPPEAPAYGRVLLADGGAAREKRTCWTCRHFQPRNSSVAVQVEPGRYECPLIGFYCPKRCVDRNALLSPGRAELGCEEWEPR